MGDNEPEQADDDHILDLIDVLQPLPDTLMSKWPRADKWIGPNGERLQPPERDYGDMVFEENDDDALVSDEEIGDDESKDGAEDGPEPHKGGEADVDESLDLVDDVDSPPPPFDAEIPEGPFINQPLEVQFEKNKPDDVDAAEAKVITTLIREILQYEPSKRPTAEQLLKHPWFKD
jgi:serine/threonine protein kinase